MFAAKGLKFITVSGTNNETWYFVNTVYFEKQCFESVLSFLHWKYVAANGTGVAVSDGRPCSCYFAKDKALNRYLYRLQV